MHSSDAIDNLATMNFIQWENDNKGFSMQGLTAQWLKEHYSSMLGSSTFIGRLLTSSLFFEQKTFMDYYIMNTSKKLVQDLNNDSEHDEDVMSISTAKENKRAYQELEQFISCSSNHALFSSKASLVFVYYVLEKLCYKLNEIQESKTYHEKACKLGAINSISLTPMLEEYESVKHTEAY